MIIKKLAVAPDASLAVNVSAPGFLSIVAPGKKEIRNAQTTLEVEVPGKSVKDLVFDNRSQYLYACGSAKRLYRWKVSDWKTGSKEVHLERLGQDSEATLTAIRPGNTDIVVDGDKEGNIRVMSTVSGKALHKFKVKGEVSSLVLSPNDKLLVSGTFEHLGKVSVEMWDLETGKRQDSMIDVSEMALCLKLSPNGRQFIVGQMNGIQIYDLIDQKIKYEARGGTIANVSYSPCGLVYAIIESSEGMMSVWDAKRFKCISVLRENDPNMQEVGMAYIRPMIVLAGESNDLQFFELNIAAYKKE